ncbi:MAG TPA: PilZ domain-containing protein [Acidimicrobiales bacterium]|nr:PilZ domain-containing protein [Acidimicrobiales bacterium]
MPERRRRVPREGADWLGKYIFEDDPEPAWGECHVLDISVLGARIEIVEPIGNEIIGREIAVEIPMPTGISNRNRFVGVIRNVSPGSDGGIQVGIQFVELSWPERAMLDSYNRMRIVW